MDANKTVLQDILPHRIIYLEKMVPYYEQYVSKHDSCYNAQSIYDSYMFLVRFDFRNKPSGGKTSGH